MDGRKRGTALNDQVLLERIAIDPGIMTGKPIIKGTRLTVEFIVKLLAHGASALEITQEYSGIDDADIQACLLFAAQSLENTVFMPLGQKVG
jgi:uncharacterized protein (DUF433 family)